LDQGHQQDPPRSTGSGFENVRTIIIIIGYRIIQFKTHGQGYRNFFCITFFSQGGVRNNIRPGRDSLPSTTEVTSDQGKMSGSK
jgi:hypothetical protein